jgi:TRAP-type mannitol/chloroaromatic compound transport system permease small subunit
MLQERTPEAYAKGEEPALLRFSNALRSFVDIVGRSGSWLILPLVMITMVDVVGRKIVWRGDDGEVYGLQIWLMQTFGPTFESTRLQELEWHFHTALFVLVLGYGYIYNAHVRVDLVRETLNFRKKAWLEFLGLVFFLLPFCSVVVYFAFIYAHDSYLVGEISASTVGLSHRWIIKSILAFGLVMAALAGLAVLAQVIVVLWGDRNRRYPLMTLEWPEDAGESIEGKARISLDDVGDAVPPSLAKKVKEEAEAQAAAAATEGQGS